VAESSSSGAHSPGPNFLSGSGIALGVARAQEPLEWGSNPEDVSLTQLTEEISYNGAQTWGSNKMSSQPDQHEELPERIVVFHEEIEESIKEYQEKLPGQCSYSLTAPQKFSLDQLTDVGQLTKGIKGEKKILVPSGRRLSPNFHQELEKDHSEEMFSTNPMMFREESRSRQRGARDKTTTSQVVTPSFNLPMQNRNIEEEEEESRESSPKRSIRNIENQERVDPVIQRPSTSTSQDAIMNMLQQMSLISQDQFGKVGLQVSNLSQGMDTKITALSEKVDCQLNDVRQSLNDVSQNMHAQIKCTDQHVRELSANLHQRVDDISRNWGEQMVQLSEDAKQRFHTQVEDADKRSRTLKEDIAQQLGNVTKNVNVQLEKLTVQGIQFEEQLGTISNTINERVITLSERIDGQMDIILTVVKDQIEQSANIMDKKIEELANKIAEVGKNDTSSIELVVHSEPEPSQRTISNKASAKTVSESEVHPRRKKEVLNIRRPVSKNRSSSSSSERSPSPQPKDREDIIERRAGKRKKSPSSASSGNDQEKVRHDKQRRKREESSDSSEDEEESHRKRRMSRSKKNVKDSTTTTRSKPKFVMQPGNFDGKEATWNAFLARFETCAEHNMWDETDKVNYLKNSLRGNAEHIIWVEKSRKWSFLELVEMLEKRFGNGDQAAFYRAMLAKRRIGPDEGINSLQQDIVVWTALAYPGPINSHTKLIAIEAFLCALDNSDLSERIRELNPIDIDDAVRHAKRLGSYGNGGHGYSNKKGGDNGRVRAITKEPIKSKINPTNNSGDNQPTPSVSNASPVNPVANGTSFWPTMPPQQVYYSNMPPQNNSPVHYQQPSPSHVIPENMANQQNNNYNSQGNYYVSPNYKGNNPRQNLISPSSGVCFYCKESGHFKRNCPKFLQDTNNNPNLRTSASSTQIKMPANAMKNKDRFISRPSYLEVELKGVNHVCLLDSGCEQTVVPAKLVKGLRLRSTPKQLYAANGTKIPVKGEVTLPLTLNGLNLHACALASDEVNEIMLGLDWMSAHNVCWNFGAGEIKVYSQTLPLLTHPNKEKCRRVLLQEDVEIPAKSQMVVAARYGLNHVFNQNHTDWITEAVETQKGLWVARTALPDRQHDLPVLLLNVNSEACMIKAGLELTEATMSSGEEKSESSVIDPFDNVAPLLEGIVESVTLEERERLKKILGEFLDIFSTGEYDVGQTDISRHTIDTGDSKPIKQVLRRQPYAHLEIIDKQVAEMLKAEIIEESRSPWVSNVVIVTKKDGSARFCIDYRNLNSVTIKDSYPLPRIDTCLDTLGGSKLFSTFDLRSGYFNVMMDKKDADKTSFVTRQGTFRFNKLPFGLCNAGSTFQRVMDISMSGLNFTSCLVYLDDIIVFSKTVDEHLTRLVQVFERLRSAKLKLKVSKCHLIQSSVSFLGHVVSDRGIGTDPAKAELIRNWPQPTSVSEVRSFLGLASYYRKFILGFACIAAPLHKLTCKDMRFKWSEECADAMSQLQEKLTSSPILAMPLDDGGFILDTDASNLSIGAILSQVQDGEERVIAYASRILNNAEKNYCVTRKELLAIVFYTKQFRQYLLGRHFQIRTDHAALQWLEKTQRPIGQQARWLNIMGEFDYTIIHRPGKAHQNADTLSRMPCRQCGANTEEEFKYEDRVELCAIHLGDKDALPDAPWSAETLAAATTEDKELEMVRKWWKEGCTRPLWKDILRQSPMVKVLWTQFSDLKVKDDVLYKAEFNIHGMVDSWRLVVPFSLRGDFIKIAHEGMTGGHLSVPRTIIQVKNRAFWLGQAKDVKIIVQQCQSCACYHRGKAPKQGELQPISTGAPFEKISLDVTGPHPKSASGKCFILTVLDHFTKWAEAFPITTHTAPVVAKILAEQVFSRFGIPLQILTDQGKEFESVLLFELCKALQIDKLRTSSYHPSTNGALERFHRTLNSMMAKTVSDSQRDWDLCLPMVMAAYRASPHSSTGYSPNFLMFGRENLAPLDLIYGFPVEEIEIQDSYDSFVWQYQQRSREAYQNAREHLQVVANRSKKTYDMKVKPVIFKEGDWVLYYCPRRIQGKSPKWQKWYSGPYLITKILAPVNAVIQLTSRSKPKVVHVDKLKMSLGKHPKPWSVAPRNHNVSPELSEEEDDEIRDKINSSGQSAEIDPTEPKESTNLILISPPDDSDEDETSTSANVLSQPSTSSAVEPVREKRNVQLPVRYR